MRVLIASCGHIRDLPRRILLELWARNLTAVAADIDVLYIDSTSPVDTAAILQPFGFRNQGAIEDDTPIDMSAGGRVHVGFKDTSWWGDPANPSGRSNEAGRAVRKGLLTAIENDYSHVFYWESDALLAVDVAKEIAKFDRLGLKVAMPWCHEYNYPETQFCLYSTSYLKEAEFIDSYDWRHGSAGIDELRREDAHRDDLTILPWRGRHNNTGWVTRQNFHEIARVSDGSVRMDWISHCDDFTLYLNFLEVNGIRP